MNIRGAGSLEVCVVLALANGRAEVTKTTLKDILKLLNRVDLLKLLTNYLKYFFIHFWVTL